MPDAAVCKCSSYCISTSVQVINDANKSDSQLSVPVTVAEASPVFLCMSHEHEFVYLLVSQ